MHTRRIFWQIFRGTLLLSGLTALILLGLFHTAAQSFYRQQTTEWLESQARFTAEQIQEKLIAGDVSFLSDISTRLGTVSPVRVTLILPDGTVAGESDRSREYMQNHRERPEVKMAIEQRRTGQSIRFSNSVNRDMMYVALPVFTHDGSIGGIVRLAMPLVAMDQAFQGFWHRLTWVGLTVLILSTMLSLLISRRISRPLERIRDGAERFARGDFSYRLHLAGSAETSLLASTMNDMAAQLEDRLQTLTNERNEREAVLSSMVEGVLAVDTGGHIISLNRAAARIFKVLESQDVSGRAIEEVFRNARLQRFARDVLEAKEMRECEIAVQNGDTTWLHACGTGLVGLHGRRIGAVIVFNDITRLRRLENLRRDFVANVSHELKTPITSIKGFVETLLDGAMNEPHEARRFLEIVAKHADRLNAIIEDLLMLSRLEQTGPDAMERQPCRLRGTLQSAVEICAQRAAEKKITLQIDCPTTLSAELNPPLIEQAMVNLISNAIKYSGDEKTVTVRASEESGGLVLSVEDHGFGIEEKHLDRLFERFYRIDKGRSRKEGGTGLGLAIVKHIAQAHGGRVTVHSRFGEGSLFSITLPVFGA